MNVFVGNAVGNAVSGGANNTFMGIDAGTSVTTGANNLLLGHDAGTSNGAGGVMQDGISNKIVLGDNAITTANIQVDWTVHSDRRDKTDIEPFTHGLSWINKLNPVTYRWDNRTDYENGTPDGTHKKPKLNLGLIAQDEHEVEKEHGYGDTLDNMLVSDLSDDGENYGMKYSKLVPILINAVKELSAEVEQLKSQINN